ncbi:MAG: hypothetical protein PQJ45_07075 [Sphaerochaetaceae bacterium]|nr:hypothetical protein [Sphaerochaetaceae bacterium]MDC7237520.1 hypothetical protein [Sphaerochaetaceae bacterium]
MEKKKISVQEYINNCRDEAKPWLEEIFKYIEKKYPSLESKILYSLPGYNFKNNYLIFGANKSYLSIHTRVLTLIDEGESYFHHINRGKGCIRIRYNQKDNMEPLKKYIDLIISNSE